MKKREINKKDWIKNILIIFLVVMLILTFFSNTILNYSLSEVSVNYITSGTISTAIRGTGTIQAVDPYSITISEGRTISSVKVKRGDTVSKGDVLFELEAGSSTEVTSAQNAYNKLLENYQTTIVDNKISSSIVSAAESKDEAGLQNKMARLEALADILKAKEDALAAIDSQINLTSAVVVDTSAEEAQLEAAQVNLDAANTKATETAAALASFESQISALQSEFAALSDEEKALCEADIVSRIVGLSSAKDTAKANNDAAKADVKIYESQITSLQKTIEDKKAAPGNQNAQLAYERAVAANEKTIAENNYNEVYNEVKYQMQLMDLLAEMETAQEEVERLQAKAIGTEILAPVSGTITSVNVVAGEKTAAEETLAVIQLTGKDYTMEMSVTREQAARIRVGDTATAASSWYYSDIALTVSAIRADTSNPASGDRIVVFTVTGSDITPGQSLTVSVGERTSSYDMIVPNNAIREDNNGTYILIVNSKSTPLGNRYVASRVDVTKLASDATNTAISCGLYGYESVITTTTKPVAAGDQVRLAE